MDIYTVVKTRRSIRRFSQSPVPVEVLEKIIDAARYAPSGGNVQPWKIIVVVDEEKVSEIFDNIFWLKAAGKPTKGEAPTGYFIILGNPEMSKCYREDCCALIQNILLLCCAENIGTCWIGSFIREKICEICSIPSPWEIVGVIAFGYPKEEVMSEEGIRGVAPSRDDRGVLHVFKRPMKEIFYINEFGKEY
jgi:nitroreductase